MQISRDFSGFTMSEADTLRKGIGKKKKEILDELHPKFVQGAIKTSGVTEQEAEDRTRFYVTPHFPFAVPA